MALSDKLQKLHDSIVVASENDPSKPEFPPNKPKYPATDIKRIVVPGFSDVSIKDESTNPTGTHKDRMAWEVVVTYKNILEAINRGEREAKLPIMSIISSGNAATAIQSMLRKYNLPDLHVLADKLMDERVERFLKNLGCKIYKADLSQRLLHSFEILKATANDYGMDITSGRGFEAIGRFYDWFSYEVLGVSPDYVIMPYGTGDLFGNVLTISAREIFSKIHDPRFQGNVGILRKCNFIGATTNNSRTRAHHLFAYFLPFEHLSERRIKDYKSRGFCGKSTGVDIGGEEHLDEALDIARGHGITTCPSGIFGLNYLLENKDRLPRDAKYIIVNTGCSQIDKIIQ
jgi:hypothetical protein